MAQLRRDYHKFQSRGAEVLALAVDKLEKAQGYFNVQRLPFPGLVDADHRVFDLYDVQSKLLSLGQRPALFIVDLDGTVRFSRVGSQQWEIPEIRLILDRLDQLVDERQGKDTA